jgi:C-terminal processing protease CtpA/Prc
MKTNLLLLIALLLVGNAADAQLPNTLTPEEKIYGLSYFWQEVNYNFVYLNQVDQTAWNEEYKRLIGEVVKTENDYEYYRLLQRFCAMLKDGHTNVYFPDDLQKMVYTSYFGDYRLFLTNVEGKAIITRVNASKKDEVPVGSEVVAVNGMPVKKYMEKYVTPYIASSTDFILEDWSVMRLFQSPIGTSYDIDIVTPDGKKKQLKLTHAETKEQEVYPAWPDFELLSLSWPEPDVAYLALNSFGDEAIDSIFYARIPELRKAKKLIIDLRQNGGGSSDVGFHILKHLVPDSTLAGSKMRSRMHIPSYKAWGVFTSAEDTVGDEWARMSYQYFHNEMYHNFDEFSERIPDGTERIVVPTVILTGHNTASAAEDFLIYADQQKHMIRIGEPTFGSTGQPLLMELPGGASARICTKEDTFPDGRKFVGVGVMPHISVVATIGDYRSNNDPALKAALDYLSKL